MVAAIAGVAGAAISAGGSMISGGQQAGAVSAASQASVAEQAREFNQTQANEQPWLAAGQGALTQTQNLLGLNGQPAATAAMNTFQSQPGYQYQVQQGLSAVDNGAAASGSLRSGNTIRAEQTLGTNLANQNFGTYYNQLASMAGLGQTTATQLGQIGQQTAAGEAGTLASEGGSLASIYGQQTTGVTNALNNGLNNGVFQNALAGYGGGASGGGNALSAFNGAGVTANIPTGDEFASGGF